MEVKYNYGITLYIWGKQFLERLNLVPTSQETLTYHLIEESSFIRPYFHIFLFGEY